MSLRKRVLHTKHEARHPRHFISHHASESLFVALCVLSASTERKSVLAKHYDMSEQSRLIGVESAQKASSNLDPFVRPFPSTLQLDSTRLIIEFFHLDPDCFVGSEVRPSTVSRAFYYPFSLARKARATSESFGMEIYE